MRVLIFHGYLLRGTGSNVYNANLAQALSRLGHDVHLLCQDRDAGVAALGRRGRPLGDRRARASRRPPGTRPESGSITAYLPDIGGILPIYVADEYVGFEARTVPGAG